MVKRRRRGLWGVCRSQKQRQVTVRRATTTTTTTIIFLGLHCNTSQKNRGGGGSLRLCERKLCLHSFPKCPPSLRARILEKRREFRSYYCYLPSPLSLLFCTRIWKCPPVTLSFYIGNGVSIGLINRNLLLIDTNCFRRL